MVRSIAPLLLLGVLVLCCCAAPLRGEWQDSSLEDEFLDFRDVSFADPTVGYLIGWSRSFDGVDLWAEGRTTDGGDLWLWQSGVYLEQTALRFHDLEHGFIVGKSPACNCPIVIYTDDGLRTWPNYEFEELRGLFTSLVSDDPQHAFFAGGNPATGEGFVARTTDGGKSFAVIMREPNAFVSNISRLDERTLIISVGTGAGNNRTLWKTTNADAEPDAVLWTPLYTFADPGDVTEMDFVDMMNGYATFAPLEKPESSGEIYRTTNGGSDWERLYTSSKFVPADIDFLDAENGFAVGSGGIILQTTDGGKSWSDTVPGPDYRILAVHYVSPTFAYAVGEAGTMLRYVKTSSAVREEPIGREEKESYRDDYLSALPDRNGGGVLLTWNENSVPSGARVVVFDLLGKNVREITPGPDAAMRIDGLSPGAYFFVLLSDRKKVLQRGKFVVR